MDDELLIERHYHLCSANPDFVPNFKKRYNIMDPILLDNKNMIFQIDSDKEIDRSIQQFIREVSQPISLKEEEQLRRTSEEHKLRRLPYDEEFLVELIGVEELDKKLEEMGLGHRRSITTGS